MILSSSVDLNSIIILTLIVDLSSSVDLTLVNKVANSYDNYDVSCCLFISTQVPTSTFNGNCTFTYFCLR